MASDATTTVTPMPIESACGRCVSTISSMYCCKNADPSAGISAFNTRITTTKAPSPPISPASISATTSNGNSDNTMKNATFAASPTTSSATSPRAVSRRMAKALDGMRKRTTGGR